MTVGAALALRGTGRIAIGICGDGDFLMGATALWTAAHYRIPLLVVVANNRSFYNDEVHQERVARMRNRPVENKWIGQRITDPDIDLAALARAQGALGFGPVDDARKLGATFAEAIAAVEHGQVAVVDVRVEPGYTPAMTAAVSNAERKELMATATRLDQAARPAAASPLLVVDDIVKSFETPEGVADRGRPHLVRGRAGRIPRGDRPVRLRQVHAVQRHRRAARRL